MVWPPEDQAEELFKHGNQEQRRWPNGDHAIADILSISFRLFFSRIGDNTTSQAQK
jgi:hypothetical protein